MNNLIPMTPEEYVYSCVFRFPSSYLSKKFEESKMKVFDHLCNTIGNGIELDDLGVTP